MKWTTAGSLSGLLGLAIHLYWTHRSTAAAARFLLCDRCSPARGRKEERDAVTNVSDLIIDPVTMAGRLTRHKKSNRSAAPIDRLVRDSRRDLHSLARENQNLVPLNFEI
jgi:hypothetical protein